MFSKRSFYLFILCIPFFFQATAQDMRWLKHQTATLAGNTMDGRGYVGKGRERAANYIQRQFKEFGLVPVYRDSSYVQTYSFAVNTFPGAMSLVLNKKEIIPGVDYLVDAASIGFEGENFKIKKADLGKIKSKEDWEKARMSISNPSYAYLLKNADSAAKRIGIPPRKLAENLPKGCFIVPVHGKMMWTVATDTIGATVLYVEDSVLPKKLRKISASIQNKLLPSVKNQNIIGAFPGTVKDSFIFITAHYDHLGKMGHEAMFPGASDNASGTAMMLYLARYFSAHPQRYTMVFVAFSGEEAGLLGSKYFTENPPVPLANIRFLLNLDIMGDATDGITVVNATEFPQAFHLLEDINRQKDYLPQIKSRGKAANSDHYHFTEKGVPAFFIYSNGGKGYYHDVFDKPSELSYNHIDGVIKLLQDFIPAL